MDNSLKNLLKMVNCTMYGREFECEGDCDWKVIYAVCNKSGLTPFLLPVIQKAGADIPEELSEAWTKLSLKAGMKQTVADLELRSLLSGAEKAGLKFTVFKGVVLASLYPQMELRCSCDADILINENERRKTVDFLTERGYIYLEGASKNNVMVFVLAGRLKLEIHTRLWEDYEGFRMDTLRELKLDDESTRLDMTLSDGMRVTTLGYTQHLIYMIYHNAKHLSLEGMGLRPMVDITYFINAYMKDIDIDELWMAMRKLDYLDFAKASFILCQRYLGMTGFVEDDGGDAADVLLDDLLAIDGTAPGNNSWQLLGLLEPYLSGDRRLPGNKAVMRLKLIFPKRDALPARYGYAKKHRLLLPAAWVHRFLHSMSERRKHKGVLEAQDKVKKAVERLEVMKKLGLVK